MSSSTSGSRVDIGANLTLKCHVLEVRFPIVSGFRIVAAGCVVHFERRPLLFIEFQQCGRVWLVTRGDTICLPSRSVERNDKKPDVVCTVDGGPIPAEDRDE